MLNYVFFSVKTKSFFMYNWILFVYGEKSLSTHNIWPIYCVCWVNTRYARPFTVVFCVAHWLSVFKRTTFRNSLQFWYSRVVTTIHNVLNKRVFCLCRRAVRKLNLLWWEISSVLFSSHFFFVILFLETLFFDLNTVNNYRRWRNKIVHAITGYSHFFLCKCKNYCSYN